MIANVLVGRPKLLWKRHAGNAAVDARGDSELAELDDRAVDAVESGGVLVEVTKGGLEGDPAVGRLEDLGGALEAGRDRLRAVHKEGGGTW